jgi:hypothetical protein
VVTKHQLLKNCGKQHSRPLPAASRSLPSLFITAVLLVVRQYACVLQARAISIRNYKLVLLAVFINKQGNRPIWRSLSVLAGCLFLLLLCIMKSLA